MTTATAVRLPSYRKHKPSGQAVVTIAGIDHYLGKYGTPASHEAYNRLIQTWLANGRQPLQQRETQSVNELMLAYLRHAKEYYRCSGDAELGCIKAALRPVKELFGRSLARDFGPLALKTVQQAMIARDWCRKTVNKQVSRVKRMFRWGVQNELLPAGVWHGLSAVEGLRRGRSEARETAPVKPVPDAFVDAIKPHVSRQIWAMIELQRLTGARPGEITILRTCDLEVSENVWVYRPFSHKNAHRGQQREIPLGPRAQEVLKPWLRAELQAHLFQPCEAEKERNKQRRAARTSPMTPSQAKRQPSTDRKRPARQSYSVTAYAKAIKRAARKASVPHWHPHQLRHNVATKLRKEHGVELARIILGHKTAFTTEIYAEADRQQAMEVIAMVG